MNKGYSFGKYLLDLIIVNPITALIFALVAFLFANLVTAGNTDWVYWELARGFWIAISIYDTLKFLSGVGDKVNSWIDY